MYEIWTSRNNLKYDKIQMTQETIITKIITHLHNNYNTLQTAQTKQHATPISRKLSV